MIYSPGDAAPFMLQSKLREQGARFQAGAAWGPFVVTDRNLITGQNPAFRGRSRPPGRHGPRPGVRTWSSGIESELSPKSRH